MEGDRLTRLAERGRPHGDSRARLELASAGEHSSGTAADQRGRAENVLDRLERHLGCGNVSAAREHDREVRRSGETSHGGRGRFDGAEPRIPVRGQTGSGRKA